MFYEIGKEFEVCFAHRVRTQDHPLGKCKRIHGHNYTIVPILIGDIDTKTQMVLDYYYFSDFKKFLDEYFDHRFVVDINDAELLSELAIKEDTTIEICTPYTKESCKFSEIPEKEGCCNLWLAKVIDDSIIKGSLIIIPVTPTAENLAKFLAEFFAHQLITKLDDRILQNIRTLGMKVKETSKTHALYGLDFSELYQNLTDIEEMLSPDENLTELLTEEALTEFIQEEEEK